MYRRISIVACICAVTVAICLIDLRSAEDAAAWASSGSAPQAAHIAPRANQLLAKACQTLSSAEAFTFHAEIMFDQVLPAEVKVQFAAAADFAVQRPDNLSVNYQSDLGGKQVWYSGNTLTVFDPPHAVYATLSVPSTIDGMLQRVHEEEKLTIPLTDLAVSNPCQAIDKQATYGGYVGVGDVNGTECDHLAFSSPTTDFQVWLDRSGKPLPRKIVINYRSLPGSPEYIAFLSHWAFPGQIPASAFRPDLPKNVARIDFLKVKESQP